VSKAYNLLKGSLLKKPSATWTKLRTKTRKRAKKVKIMTVSQQEEIMLPLLKCLRTCKRLHRMTIKERMTRNNKNLLESGVSQKPHLEMQRNTCSELFWLSNRGQRQNLN